MPAPERALLETWTAGQQGNRSDQIAHLTRLVLGPDAPGMPWDVATAALLALAADGRAATIGAVTRCPSCTESVEVDVPLDALLAVAPAPDRNPPVGAGTVPVVEHMVTAAALPSDDAEAYLAAVCGLDGHDAGQRAAALEALDAAHPLLAPSVALRCPSCDAEVDAAVDAVALAWAAVDGRARACLDDVVVLAAAFGWTEAEVLAVPASRRATYRLLADGMAVGG